MLALKPRINQPGSLVASPLHVSTNDGTFVLLTFLYLFRSVTKFLSILWNRGSLDQITDHVLGHLLVY